jgi:phosphatidylinositol alpha-1,6-mannosyltransferase
MYKKMMLLTLETFKSTGGIQHMTRTMAWSLNNLAEENDSEFQLWSLHDNHRDLNEAYLPTNRYKSFDGNKFSLLKNLLLHIKWPQLVIISHVNLAIAGLIIKLFNSKCRVWVVAHGIEIWSDLSPIKRRLLDKCDTIVCVSKYTKKQLIAQHRVPEGKCVVLNNALDPFFAAPQTFEKPVELLRRYNISINDKVLLTLTRINGAEQYKGYDRVITAVAALKKNFPNVKYILAGKSDLQEQTRLEQLVVEHHLQDCVIFAGFIDQSQLTNHFLLADIFVMPSKGEGFGLVLIEAAACGTTVICGSADGSVDAIKNGELGLAIEPDNTDALIAAITKQLQLPLDFEKRKLLQQKCLEHFKAGLYKEKLNTLICDR